VFLGFTAIVASLLGDGRFALRYDAAPSRTVTA
jgi:hypothetical protein